MTVEWIRNARLANRRRVDIGVREGRIDAVDDHDPDRTAGIDLGGWLLLPPLTEPHAHLDKACSAETVGNPSGDLDGAIGEVASLSGKPGEAAAAWLVRARALAAAETAVADIHNHALGALAKARGG